MARIPVNPRRPDRVCWGCDKYCPADDLACGNGTIRTPHPAELFGGDWLDWIAGRETPAAARDAPNTSGNAETSGDIQ